MTEARNPPAPEGGGETSCFSWADELLAGYGIYVRDSYERTFSRMLDILAARDFPSRQVLVGPRDPERRRKCAR